MADPIVKERSFIPPTSIEYDAKTGGSDTIIWSLGSAAHPWKNLYICDPDHKYVEEGEIIDVYERLGQTSFIPYDDTRQPGSFLTSDDNKNLVWRKLNNAFKDPTLGVQASSVVTVLGETPVLVAKRAYEAQTEEEKADPTLICNKYLKKDNVTAQYLVDKLGNTPVNRATADAAGNEIATEYGKAVVVEELNNCLSQRIKGTSVRQVQEVAFTGDYNDLAHKPTGDWVTWKAFNQEIATINSKIHNIYKLDELGNETGRLMDIRTELKNDDAALKLELNTRIDQVYDTLNTRITTEVATLNNTITALDVRVSNRITALETNKVDAYFTKSFRDKVDFYDGATSTQPGVVKVIEGNGFKATTVATTKPADRSTDIYPSSQRQTPCVTTLSVNKATSSGGYGTLTVGNGNGLDLDSNGKLTMSYATTTTPGAIKLGMMSGTYTSYSAVPSDGQWYRYNGSITIESGSEATSMSGSWLTMKLKHNSDSDIYCFIHKTNDPKAVFHSVNSGSNWYAPYATWHA